MTVTVSEWRQMETDLCKTGGVTKRYQTSQKHFGNVLNDGGTVRKEKKKLELTICL